MKSRGGHKGWSGYRPISAHVETKHPEVGPERVVHRSEETRMYVVVRTTDVSPSKVWGDLKSRRTPEHEIKRTYARLKSGKVKAFEVVVTAYLTGDITRRKLAERDLGIFICASVEEIFSPMPEAVRAAVYNVVEDAKRSEAERLRPPSKETLLAALETALRGHDWDYQKRGHEDYVKGVASSNRISNLMRSLREMDAEEEAIALWKEYCPMTKGMSDTMS